MDELKRKIVVISGINIRKGGTLSIFYEFLDEIVEKEIYKKYDVRIMVSDENLFKEYRGKVEIHHFKEESKSRLKRYYYEYVWMKEYSKKNDVFLWLSINDKTPSVVANYRAVYCHNNTMFCRLRLREFFKYRRMVIYSLLYPLLWKKNIKENDMVVVQQHWLAEAFEKGLGLNNVCVMRPRSIAKSAEAYPLEKECSDKYIFIYPTKACAYKNVDLICKASAIMRKKFDNQYIVYITIDENDGKYAKSLMKKYSSDSNLKFCGFLPKEDLFKKYAEAECLIFPSRLETWGLPLTEFAKYGKNIIASDLPYAHENLMGYKMKAFVDPDSPEELASLMEQAISKVKFEYDKSEKLADNHREIGSLIDIIECAEQKVAAGL